MLFGCFQEPIMLFGWSYKPIMLVGCSWLPRFVNIDLCVYLFHLLHVLYRWFRGERT
jgi:hypothetical protein